MTQYICNPIEVSAWQITEICPEQKEQGIITVVLDDNALYDIDPSKMSRMIPVVGDYLVRTNQPDVYEYLNPKHVFEAKYTKVENV